MCGLFQPIGQVRLTNVATVRLKVKDQRFEIACYRNKIVNWRSGVETDIQEVLQCPYIFTSISKGKLAKNAELIKAFNTTDTFTICKQILDKGEYQISKEEREQLLESTFKDIVSILHEVTINPNTGHPLARSLLENALKSTGFSVTLNEPAKKQALKALSLLQKFYPDDIARTKMRLRITCLSQQHDQVLNYLKNNNAYIEQDEGYNFNYQHHVPSAEGTTLEVQSDSSSTSTIGRPADSSSPLEVHPAVSSSNYLSLKSIATPRDRGEESETIHGSRGEVNREATTPSGMRSSTGPQVEPVADLREAEGDINREGSTPSGMTSGRMESSIVTSGGVDDDVMDSSRYSGVIRILFLCCPSLFREIDSFVVDVMDPPGSLQLVSLNVKDITNKSIDNDGGNLTPSVESSIIDGDKTIQDVTSNEFNTSLSGDFDKKMSINEVINTDSINTNMNNLVTSPTSGSFKCTSCNIYLPSASNYRNHCKSDLHVLNSKRKLKGMEPITEDDYKFIKDNIENNTEK